MSDTAELARQWQQLADEFCEFNKCADHTIMHNFAGWLAARDASPVRPAEPSAAAVIAARKESNHTCTLGMAPRELSEGRVAEMLRAAYAVDRGVRPSPDGPWGVVGPGDGSGRYYATDNVVTARLGPLTEREAIAVRDALNQVAAGPSAGTWPKEAPNE